MWLHRGDLVESASLLIAASASLPLETLLLLVDSSSLPLGEALLLLVEASLRPAEALLLPAEPPLPPAELPLPFFEASLLRVGRASLLLVEASRLPVRSAWLLAIASAARRTARSMDMWVPQRHFRPASIARISLSLGVGLRSSPATVVMIQPFVQ
jgi:hypothetical protein